MAGKTKLSENLARPGISRIVEFITLILFFRYKLKMHLQKLNLTKGKFLWLQTDRIMNR